MNEKRARRVAREGSRSLWRSQLCRARRRRDARRARRCRRGDRGLRLMVGGVGPRSVAGYRTRRCSPSAGRADSGYVPRLRSEGAEIRRATHAAGIGFSAMLGLQVALAAGAPLGHAAWDGAHTPSLDRSAGWKREQGRVLRVGDSRRAPRRPSPSPLQVGHAPHSSGILGLSQH